MNQLTLAEQLVNYLSLCHKGCGVSLGKSKYIIFFLHSSYVQGYLSLTEGKRKKVVLKETDCVALLGLLWM